MLRSRNISAVAFFLFGTTSLRSVPTLRRELIQASSASNIRYGQG